MEREFVPAWYYQQFDADHSLAFPGLGYGGWKKERLPLNPERTAFVVMHAWDAGTPEQYPGWYRAVEYLPRANRICEELLPPFLRLVRESGIRLIYVASGNQRLAQYPGYANAVAWTENPGEGAGQVETDPVHAELLRFKQEHAFVGSNNAPDVRLGQRELDFHPAVRPQGDEPVVCTTEQLYALCRRFGINHLIYTGFAVNMCLTVSPGGFVDMLRHGVLCSVVRELTTAVENRETCREQSNLAYGLWYFSILSGFVYDLDDMTAFLRGQTPDKRTT